ncbi:MAG: general secretion pathway protein GspB [Candidatus Methylomirabilota bacterium]
MSYILEALRKADRERERSRSPLLRTLHGEPKRPRRRRWWIAVGLALGLLPLSGWLLMRIPEEEPARPAPPGRVEAAPPAAAVPASEPVARGVPTPSPAHPPAAPPPVAEPPTTPVRPSAASRRLLESRATAPEGVRSAETPLRQAAPAAAESAATSAPAPPPPAKGAGAPAAGGAPAPQPARQEAPATLSITVLVHSADARDRLVYINGRRYAEGDTVEERYLVEAIQPDGVLLSHHGDRFLLPAGFGASTR